MTYQEMTAYINLKFRMRADQVARLVRFVEDLDDAYLSDYLDKQTKKS